VVKGKPALLIRLSLIQANQDETSSTHQTQKGQGFLAPALSLRDLRRLYLTYGCGIFSPTACVKEEKPYTIKPMKAIMKPRISP
jgi:hypothetical protein